MYFLKLKIEIILKINLLFQTLSINNDILRYILNPYLKFEKDCLSIENVFDIKFFPIRREIRSQECSNR